MDESELTSNVRRHSDALAPKCNVPIDQIYSRAYPPTTLIIPAK